MNTLLSTSTMPRFLTCLLILGVLALPAWGHDETRETLEVFLHDLEVAGDISGDQHSTIERIVWGDHDDEHDHGKHGEDEHGDEGGDMPTTLRQYLDGQAFAKRMTPETAEYLKTMFQVAVADVSFASVPSSYTGTGNVTRLGHVNVDPPSPYYSDNTSTGQLYSGIWGHAVGSREYALQCNSNGLHVIDVTNPASAFRVQFIPMAGGRIWRDVQTHEDLPSGKTYAYVGAQSSGNLWVVDLSYLSGTTAHGVDSNPIPPAGYVDRGRTNYGHTVAVHEGLLFMNAAGSNGCQIFDLLANPWDPPLVASWSGSGRDCHDSFARGDVLYSGDGYSRSYRLVDISNVRTTGTTSLIGSTISQSGSYGHSTWLSDDGQYLYGFDEFNVFDISVHDISNPAAPVHVTNFQYSGDGTENSRAHNCQIRGDYLLCGYYEAGFRAFDVSNPANPVEVGKDETWRDPDGDGNFENAINGNYDGGWNVHIFLPSGNVLVSDMETGTFILDVAPVALPGVPGGLSAVAGDSQANLSWAASSGATGTGVHRSTSPGGPYTTVAAQLAGTSYVDGGLSNGTTYYYVVSATNAAGESAYSNEDSATPFAAPPCGDAICETGEDCNTCPADCPALGGTTCGNGICEAGDGEDCVTCAADCNGQQGGNPSGRFCCGFGGSNPVGCGDAACTTGGYSCTETPQGGGACCGDLLCESPEDYTTCGLDCGAPVCGDASCDPGEDACSCASDCGTPPSSEAGLCSDGVDNDCDGDTDSADSDCGGSCLPAGTSCTDDTSGCCNGCSGGKPGSRTCL